MRCPKCKDRLCKSDGESTTWFVKKMVLRKSDNKLFMVCRCGEMIASNTPDTLLLKDK